MKRNVTQNSLGRSAASFGPLSFVFPDSEISRPVVARDNAVGSGLMGTSVEPAPLLLKTTSASNSTRNVRCREIKPADLEPIIDLLTTAYQISTRSFWERRIKRFSQHAPPPGYPKYGFLLECNGAPVGVIFTMFSLVVVGNETKVRCYPVTWYVAPAYRIYATLLASKALKYRDVTFILGTPIEHVRPILATQGYVRYCEGRFISVPALSRQSGHARVELASAETDIGDDITPFEAELLSGHADFGCISLICTSGAGQFPFVFQPRHKRGVVRFVRLVYCRDFPDFVQFAAPIGRFLARRGYPLVVLDANEPIPGLVGKYSDNFPKFYRGPHRPRLGDFAYSSRVIFDY